MKAFRKLLSLILIACLTLSLSSAAFAEDIGEVVSPEPAVSEPAEAPAQNEGQTEPAQTEEDTGSTQTEPAAETEESAGAAEEGQDEEQTEEQTEPPVNGGEEEQNEIAGEGEPAVTEEGAEQPSENDGPQPAGYFATFIADNAVVNVYYGQDYTAPDETNVTKAVARAKGGADIDVSGDGQINFGVVPAEGYVIDKVSAEGGYKNLKEPADTGAEGVYRLTKVTGDVTVTITTKPAGESGEQEPAEQADPYVYYLTPEGFTDSLGVSTGSTSLKIKKAGTYTVIGQGLTDYVNGRIQIQAEGVKVILQDVRLTWTNGASINAKFDTEIEVRGVCYLTRVLDQELDPTDDGGKVIKGESETPGEGVSIYFSGDGELNIDAPKKGIGVDVFMEGLEFEKGLMANGEKTTIKLDSTVTLDGPTFKIISKNEAIEANIIIFKAGLGMIDAGDDGINVGIDADDADEDDLDGDGNVREKLYPNVSYDYRELDIIFEGGEWYLNSENDGIDSNGNVHINGGTVVVFGSVASDNAAVDYGGESGGVFEANEGVLLAVGNSTMQEMPKGLYLFVRGQNVKAGDKISVTTADGAELLYAYAPAPKDGANCILFCSPELKEGETYIITVGDASTEVKAVLGDGASREMGGPSREPSGEPSGEQAQRQPGKPGGASGEPKIASQEMGVGVVYTYDFGDVVIHAYDASNEMEEAAYLIEGKDALVGVSMPADSEPYDVWTEYIEKLDKPLEGIFVTGTPLDAADAGEEDAPVKILGLEEQDKDSQKDLMDWLDGVLGDALRLGDELAEVDTAVKDGDKLTMAGVELEITEREDGYDIAIPSLKAVFSGVPGKNSFGLYADAAAIDDTAKQLKKYQEDGIAYLFGASGQALDKNGLKDAVAYNEELAALSADSADAAAFTEAVKKAFPRYTGEALLARTAENLFG